MLSFRKILVLAALFSIAAPAAALACSMVQGDPLRPRITTSDLRFMRSHEASRGAWVQSTSWVTSRLTIDQQVQVPGSTRVHSAAFRQQRSLRLFTQDPGGGTYTEDQDPATTCALAGQKIWSDTKVLLRETPRAIFVVAITRKTPGDATGCGTSITSCDDITTRIVGLAAPIGARQVYSTTFA